MKHSNDLAARLQYLRNWWEEHGPTLYNSADEWINSMSNVDLITCLTWAED